MDFIKLVFVCCLLALTIASPTAFTTKAQISTASATETPTTTTSATKAPTITASITKAATTTTSVTKTSIAITSTTKAPTTTTAPTTTLPSSEVTVDGQTRVVLVINQAAGKAARKLSKLVDSMLEYSQKTSLQVPLADSDLKHSIFEGVTKESIKDFEQIVEKVMPDVTASRSEQTEADKRDKRDTFQCKWFCVCSYKRITHEFLGCIYKYYDCVNVG